MAFMGPGDENLAGAKEEHLIFNPPVNLSAMDHANFPTIVVIMGVDPSGFGPFKLCLPKIRQGRRENACA